MLNTLIKSKPIRYLGVTLGIIPFYFSTLAGAVNAGENKKPKFSIEEKGNLESLLTNQNIKFQKGAIQESYAPNFIFPADVIDVNTTDINGNKTKDFMPGDKVIYNGTMKDPHLVALVLGNVDYGSSKENLNPFFNLFGGANVPFSWQKTIPTNATKAEANLTGIVNLFFYENVTHNLNLKELEINDVYVTDENGNILDSYTLGQNVKHNIKFTIPETELLRDVTVYLSVNYPSLGTFDIGEQQVNDSPPGEITITFDDYIPSNAQEETATNNFTVAIGDYEKQSSSNFKVVEAFLLQGRVEDIHGNPLSDLEIEINGDTIYTNVDGNYSTKLKKGDYVLSIPHETYYNFAKKVNISGNSTDNLIQMFERQTFHFEEADVDLLDALKILTGTDGCDLMNIPPIDCWRYLMHWEIDKEPINIFLNKSNAEEHVTKLSPEDFVEAVKNGIVDWETKTNEYVQGKKFNFYNFIDNDSPDIQRIKVDYSGYDKNGNYVSSGRFLWESNDDLLKRGTVYLNPGMRSQPLVRRVSAHEMGRGLHLTNPYLEEVKKENPLYTAIWKNSTMGGGANESNLEIRVTDLDGKVSAVFHRLLNNTKVGFYTK